MLCKCLTLLGEMLQPKLLLQSEAFLNTDDRFKDLQEQLDKLAVYNPKFFPKATTANDIVSVDDSFSTEPLMIDDAILIWRLGWRRSWDQRWHRWCLTPICPQANDVRQSMDVLREHMLFSDNGGLIHKFLNRISVLVEKKLSAKLRQADIRSFFQ